MTGNHGPFRPEDVISTEVANQVLFYFGEGGYPPGSFVQQLLRTITNGDRQNRARLALGFPDYVAAMDLAQYDPDGLDRLKSLTGGAS
jgi:hypothetical protein